MPRNTIIFLLLTLALAGGTVRGQTASGERRVVGRVVAYEFAPRYLTITPPRVPFLIVAVDKDSPGQTGMKFVKVCLPAAVGPDDLDELMDGVGSWTFSLERDPSCDQRLGTIRDERRPDEQRPPGDDLELGEISDLRIPQIILTASGQNDQLPLGELIPCYRSMRAPRRVETGATAPTHNGEVVFADKNVE